MDSEEEWKNLKMDEIIKVKDYSEIPKGFTGIVEFSNGTKSWYKNGKRHRENAPAIIYSNGKTEWWINNKFFKKSQNKILIKNLEIDIKDGF